MKLAYTYSEVKAWRGKVQRKTSRDMIGNKAQALKFIEQIGYCLAYASKGSEPPCLLNTLGRIPNYHTLHTSQGEMNGLLAENKIFYGRLLRNQPTVVSMEYLPYFYTLSRRSGTSDEYMTEFVRGNLSSASKAIMDALSDSSPQVTKGLRLSSGFHRKGDKKVFDRAITDLQEKMFITNTGEHHDAFTPVWDTVLRRFPKETKKSRRISEEQARQRILQKYFENQLVGTVGSIQKLFRWDKQDIFRTLGSLKNAGVITPDVSIDGQDDKYYGLVY